ncbi:hypothetical protein TVAG_374930 [Trichomonas vaginalis G3]|uniref:Uncharacterized protein n=1 Tax=Trichomonas vaginalis (strain ATCC PRA-98 / G3) TaxID=412133 RepID=A2FUQ8_TRIV3|nr:hypothetical protein TVAGG3_0626640 [Trichomonas vaginalis G3]EAX91347.1 hypothetical protein TVAG_374930 [Trichomonas vaginalis G3]KAI5504243.1 hypothetical protein TVAGG3_0626640 [Trichomonas vaginalis G3]|eukprot:XP_001304277.1 hypothetical protein [Trichomonas vaginalis G3]
MNLDSPQKIKSPTSTLQKEVEIPVLPPSWQNINTQSPRNNLRREISYENSQLTTPEALTYQKNLIQSEIQKLREEIKPLTDKYRSLQIKADEKNGYNSQIVHNNEMSSQLADLHAEYDNQKERLAKYRRFYTQATQNKLEAEIKQHLEEIGEFNRQNSLLQEQLNSTREKLKSILSSPLAASIKEQEKVILNLADERDELRDIEDQLIAKHTEDDNDEDTFQMLHAKVESLKKKLSALTREKMQKSYELRKLSLEREEQIMQLKLDMQAKKELNEDRKRKKELRKKIHNDLINSKQPTLKLPDGTSKIIHSPRYATKNKFLDENIDTGSECEFYEDAHNC